MKRFALVIAALLILSYACADIGPSPSYSFAIIDQQDYDYDFFYQGKILNDRMYEVSGKNPVYKLDTTITIYAAPKGTDPNLLSDEIKAISFKSQEISLSEGHTGINIIEFNEATKELVTNLDSYEPDVDYLVPDLMLLAFLVLIVVVVAAVICGLYLLSNRMRNKKS